MNASETPTVGGLYTLGGQADKLVYRGKLGSWYQFAWIGDTRRVWCEVLAQDLNRLEAAEGDLT